MPPIGNVPFQSNALGAELPEILKERINASHGDSTTQTASFVLYLPTVVLRMKHNPAFAVACRLANHYQVPLIVLAVVLDDAHMPSHREGETPPIVMTSRRLAFVLEALQYVTRQWEEHGAGVAVRVHGPQARTPHHLTLARNAVAVVTDEPFVHPHLGFCQAVERATRVAGVPCYRVDGSTTVPPVSVLQPQRNENSTVVSYKGVPPKAWMWQKKTEAKRKGHVYGAVREGHLDAPELVVKLEPGFFVMKHGLGQYLPTDWQSIETSAPDRRPWTVEELSAIENIKEWALSWRGADASVPPCQQTHGSFSAGQQRWKMFHQSHLSSYARLRNQIQKPHAVSRMSCYLNYGIVSIFQVIYDLWQAKANVGSNKYQDEIIKWREMSYAHAFSAPTGYNQEASVPQWSRSYLEGCRRSSRITDRQYTRVELQEGQTDDGTWNAMQRYLLRTGELHNNARMTWGKTVVHWQKDYLSVGNILEELCYQNDRYALDGLAPPSYAGILWCLGWCDKPGGGGKLSEKPASRYRVGPDGFEQAERSLLLTEKRTSQRSIADMMQPQSKRQRKENQEKPSPSSTMGVLSAPTNTLLSYFHSPTPSNTNFTAPE